MNKEEVPLDPGLGLYKKQDMQGYNEMGKKKNIENGNTSNKKCST